MRSKLFIILLGSLFISSGLYAQLSVLDKSDFRGPVKFFQENHTRSWHCLRDNDLVNKMEYIATIECSNKYLFNSYRRIQNRAKRMGGNIFKFESYSYNEEKDKEILKLKIYYADESVVKMNNELKFENRIYIHCNDYDDVVIEVNDLIKTLKSSSFATVQKERSLDLVIGLANVKNKSLFKSGIDYPETHIGVGDFDIPNGGITETGAFRAKLELLPLNNGLTSISQSYGYLLVLIDTRF